MQVAARYRTMMLSMSPEYLAAGARPAWGVMDALAGRKVGGGVG